MRVNNILKVIMRRKSGTWDLNLWPTDPETDSLPVLFSSQDCSKVVSETNENCHKRQGLSVKESQQSSFSVCLKVSLVYLSMYEVMTMTLDSVEKCPRVDHYIANLQLHQKLVLHNVQAKLVHQHYYRINDHEWFALKYLPHDNHDQINYYDVSVITNQWVIGHSRQN